MMSIWQRTRRGIGEGKKKPAAKKEKCKGEDEGGEGGGEAEDD